jgi:hypothetical protein
VYANNVGNAGPHVRQTFLNDVFTFLTEVGNAGCIVNTGTSSVNSEVFNFISTDRGLKIGRPVTIENKPKS